MNNLDNSSDLNRFIEDLNKFDIDLNENQITQFLLYYNILIEWNSFMNLTAITDFNEVLQKHFVDSVSLIKAIPDLKEKDYKIIDVGTGAGFPGVPLKIAFPKLNITLLDSLNKRVKFLIEVIRRLELNEINVLHGRAEDFSKQGVLREKFDICVSRAVANMSVLSEYCIPFVKETGFFVPYKSDNTIEELEKSQRAIKILGGTYKTQVEFYLPHSDIYRKLFIIEKTAKTPLKYPRKAGLPAKEPL